MKRFKQKLAILLSISMILTGIVPVHAATAGTDVYLAYNESTKAFDSIPIPGDATQLTSSMKTWGREGTQSWYVLNSNVNIGSRIQVEGTVNLILKDGFKLTAPKGIRVRYGTALHIYAGEKGTGLLYVTEPDDTDSGIGGNGGHGKSNPEEQCGDITIDGGIIETRGGENGAGIGAGSILSPACNENKGSITINGGHVRAVGTEGGAGIGGGNRNNSGTITINGGYVEAYVDTYKSYTSNGAGIGGGYQSNSNKIEINGGTIIAIGAGFCAGIGGGYQGGTGTIDIKGGNIRATGGKGGSAAIGSAVINSGGTVNISGGTIYAEAFYESGRNGAVIGGGSSYKGNGCSVNISGGKIDAIAHGGVGKAMGNGTVTIDPNGKLFYVEKEFGASYEGSPFSETTVLKNFSREIHIREQEKYNITWKYGNSSDVTVATEGEIPKHANPEQAGYAFRCWVPEVTSAIEDATYIAIFDEIEAGNVSVSFDTNGGSWIDTQIIASGSAPSRPADPERTGYSFDGWYSDKGLTSKYIFDTAITKNTVLYAKWNPESYTVEFDANYDEGTAHPATMSVTYGSPYGTMAKCSRDGYIFDGWYTESLGGMYVASTSVCNKADDHTLFAHWIEEPKEQYTVSFNTNGGSFIEAQKVVYEECAVRPEDPTKTGYNFVDWYADAEFVNKFDFDDPITEDTTVYAKWDIKSYTINWLGGLNGETLIASTKQEYNSYPVFPKDKEGKLEIDGYVFSGWDKDFEAVTQDVSYTATYKEKDPEYCYGTLRIYTDNSVNTYVQKIEKGGNIRLTNNVRRGYTFDGWYTNQSFEGTRYSDKYGPIYVDTTVYARYIPHKYTISWMDGENLLATGSWALGERPEYNGDPAKLVKTGYVFTGWNPQIAEVEGDTTYKAVFVSKSAGQCVVSFDSCGGTSVEAKVLEKGEIATPPEPDPERTGFKFFGWFTDKDYIDEYDFSKPLASDITLYAKWIPQDYIITWSVDGVESHEIMSYGVMPDFGSVPEKDGYIFTGWNPALKPVEENATYTAQFTALYKERLIVDFNTLGGSHIPAQKIVIGEKATRPATDPTKTDYIFTDWFEDAECTKTFDFDTPITEDIMIYAGWTYNGGHHSGGGGGSSVKKPAQPAGAVVGFWTYHADIDKWTFAVGDHNYFDQWAYVYNPNATGNQPAASWFYFDIAGNMMTGWQWIKGSDGITRCYYLNPVSDNTLGACFMGPGTTPDGFTVDSNGAWTVNGVVQTR